MRGAMLFAAGLFTGLAVQVGIAQNAGGVVMMNHVGINVPDIVGISVCVSTAASAIASSCRTAF